MALHIDTPFNDSHFAHAFEYVDATARTSAGGFTATDVGKLARQLDDNSFWILTTTAPNWTALTGSGGAGSTEIHEGSTAPGDINLYWVDTNTTPSSWKYHNGSSWVSFLSSISVIDIRPSDMRLDGTNIGSDNSVIWNIISAIDFDSDDDGSIWFSFKFPQSWNTTSDINFTIQYSCNGNDPLKVVMLNSQTWVINDGDIPAFGSPNNTNSDSIATSVSNIDTIRDFTLVFGKVDNADLTSTTNTVVVKLTREASNVLDTYTGTFQLISVQLIQ